MVLITLRGKGEAGYVDEDPVTSSAELFQDLAADWKGHGLKTTEQLDDDLEILSNGRDHQYVWMTSYEDIDSTAASAARPKIIANTQGFAGAMIYAYQNDLSIVIRPDDVWLAILIQFSFYVNKHADELRPKIAGYDGKKPLEIDLRHDLNDKSLRGLAQKIINTLSKDVITTKFASSLLPSFNTTNETDRWVATIAILGSLKHYLEDVPTGNCGLVSVRLDGRKPDWKSICDRVKALGEGNYGEEVKEWASYLSIVCEYFLASVEKRGTEEIKSFWNLICHVGGRQEENSTPTLGGWITAFCFWDPDRNRIRNYSPEEIKGMCARDGEARQDVMLNGVRFPVISTEKSIPAGVTEFKMVVAQEHEGVQYEVSVIAGLMALKCMKHATGRTGLDTIQLVPGYWMVEDDCKPLWTPQKALYD
ncbi:hypothetical protein UCRPA7_3334 [Phaeoacremonium minimum UCRPA7]|uniref:Uncharacterized protein n=1 Tax=Phaeoacremonium minimum (strain UCR-PA7) TaxID=1286976 RepID=R8BP37_PHAM7|nr:hypothetical protein UCRPA7_3334 [Phaeoacremonium minimum UCRPA7]EOO01163.1 hypothetical protein UCRPA7_3334 [Phaeoacremonium minimum UCRPA7]